MSETIRVLVADDYDVVRRGICEYLAEEPDIEVVGQAKDGVEALAQVEALRPDVAILDIQMPNISGVEATNRIKALYPGIKVLILTAFDSDPYIFALLKAGANGYLLKTAGPEDLVRAVRVVHQGQSWLGPEVAQRVTGAVAGGRLIETGAEPQTALTERELEVLRLVARGLTSTAIGHELNISERTVHGHLANVLAKLHAANRTEAVLKALKLGWIGLDDVTDGQGPY